MRVPCAFVRPQKSRQCVWRSVPLVSTCGRVLLAAFWIYGPCMLQATLMNVWLVFLLNHSGCVNPYQHWQPACKSSNHAHSIYLFQTVRGTLLIPICYVTITSPSGSPRLPLGFPNSLHVFLVHDLSIPFKGSATKILTKHIATKSSIEKNIYIFQPLIFTKNNSDRKSVV